MQETNLIIGSAGCAKTTYLIEKLKEEIQQTPIQKIAFISFTKAAVLVAISKAKQAFPDLKDKDFINFRTLHSFCFIVLNCTMNKMIDSKLRGKFEDVMGDLGQEAQIDFDEFTALTKRNLPLYLYHVAENRREDIETVYRKYDYDVSLSDINYIIDCYKSFKKHNNVYDYNDLLLEVIKRDIQPLDIDVVFLDEAQDNSKLQYEVFFKLFAKAKKVYIAGDDLQNLYTWSGSDVKEFLNLKYTNKKVLDVSYRLPSTILEFSKKIAERIPEKNRFAKQMKTIKQGGKIEKIFSIESIKGIIIDTLKKGQSWLFLVRNIYLSNQFKDPLYDAGIPFLEFGNPSYNEDELRTIINYEDYRKGYIELTDILKSDFSLYMPEINIENSWYVAFRFLPLEVANYYRSIMNNGFSFRNYVKGKRDSNIYLRRPQIEISTIHRTKGREADHVVVLPDMSQLTHKMSELYKDEEHRVFYTACTRAKETLYLMEPLSQLYYDLNI